MSFSLEVKEELAGADIVRRCCVTAEISALSQCLASFSTKGRGNINLFYACPSPTVAKRLLKLFRAFSLYNIGIALREDKRFGGRRTIVLSLAGAEARKMMLHLKMLRREDGVLRYKQIPQRVVRRICCQRAFIRGMFLGCGSVNAPGKGYHAEFRFRDKNKAEFFNRVLALQNLNFAISKRKADYLVYAKKGADIANLLAAMEAVRSLLKFEDYRTMSQVKQKALRQVNCDQANVSRQISASQKQLDTINRISKLAGLSALPKRLEELARLRISHPDYSLTQLGEAMDKAVSKASVSRYFKQMEQFAEGLDSHIPSGSNKNNIKKGGV
jgi:DNA-binding protein WhiA